ncbi:MAG: acyl-CoA reductase [Burkholderia gladioli]
MTDISSIAGHAGGIIEIGRLPSTIDVSCETIHMTTDIPPDAHAHWTCRRLARGSWASAAAALRRAGTRLKALPIDTIVAGIDRVAGQWCDRAWPVRIATRDRIAAVTGLSHEVVDRSFDVELKNYRADSLWRALRNELGDPSCLDRPVRRNELDGQVMAIGPDLALAIFTSNVPGLPALSIVRSLLVKAPLIAKVSSAEPCFAAAFVDSLAQAVPEFADAIVVTYWARDETDLLCEIAREVDVVIAYGGEPAIEAISAELPPGVRLIEHAHRLSWGFVSSDYRERHGIEALSKAIASDVSAFNQHACIAPQAYFVETSPDEARQLAQAVAHALSDHAIACPLGTLATTDAMRLRMLRAEGAWRSASDDTAGYWHEAGLQWSVSLGETLDSRQVLGHRNLQLVRVTSPDGVLAQVLPHRRYLQNAAIGMAEPERFRHFAVALAHAGVSRICEPGRMHEPSMMWHHDGRTCITELVRWCDIEMHSQLQAIEDE